MPGSEPTKDPFEGGVSFGLRRLPVSERLRAFISIRFSKSVDVLSIDLAFDSVSNRSFEF